MELPAIQVWRPMVVSACSNSGDQPSRSPCTASPIDRPVNAWPRPYAISSQPMGLRGRCSAITVPHTG